MNKNLRWSFGFIVGAAGCGMLLNQLGAEMNGIVRIVLIIGVGVGTGWLLETVGKQ